MVVVCSLCGTTTGRAQDPPDAEATPLWEMGMRTGPGYVLQYQSSLVGYDQSRMTLFSHRQSTAELLWCIRDIYCDKIYETLSSNGAVYCVSNSSIQAYFAENGQKRWTFPSGSSTPSPISGIHNVFIAENVLLMAFTTYDAIAVVNLATGKLLWSTTLSSISPSAVNSIESVVYVPADPSHSAMFLWSAIYGVGILATESRTGTIVWKQRVSEGLQYAPSVSCVYDAEERSMVVLWQSNNAWTFSKLHPQNGTLITQVSLLTYRPRLLYFPSVGGQPASKAVLVECSEWEMKGYFMSNLTCAFSLPSSAALCYGAQAIGSGALLRSISGTVEILNPRNGRKLWTINKTDPFPKTAVASRPISHAGLPMVAVSYGTVTDILDMTSWSVERVFRSSSLVDLGPATGCMLDQNTPYVFVAILVTERGICAMTSGAPLVTAHISSTAFTEDNMALYSLYATSSFGTSSIAVHNVTSPFDSLWIKPMYAPGTIKHPPTIGTRLIYAILHESHIVVVMDKKTGEVLARTFLMDFCGTDAISAKDYRVVVDADDNGYLAAGTRCLYRISSNTYRVTTGVAFDNLAHGVVVADNIAIGLSEYNLFAFNTASPTITVGSKLP